jgi:hypothetical protein
MYGYGRVEVLKMDIMKNTVFWDLAPYNLIEFYRRFRGMCWLHLQARRINYFLL